MKFRINKTKITAIILSILMVTSIAMITLPVQAQLAARQPVSGPLPSYATSSVFITETRSFLSFRPNPIGLGQSLLVNMWINPALPSNNRLLPQAFVITLTKPDGTKEARTIDSEPATGANWFEYFPDQVGIWTIKFDFIGTYFPAGQYYNGKVVTNSSGNLYAEAYYKPSSTEAQNLTVQQDFVASWPAAALPTDYWTRPVAVEHREWWPILGNWPGTGYQGGGPVWDALYPNTNPCWSATANPGYGFTPWVIGPNSAHIVWKRQGAIAGITGGPAGQYSQTSSPGNPSLVYAGRAYQTMTVPINGVPTSCAVCYDLRTGEQYYAIPTAAPTNGITPNLIAYVNPVASSNTIAGQEIAGSTWTVELMTISGSSLLKVNPYSGAVSNYSIAPLSGGSFHNQIGGYVLSIQTIGTGSSTHYQLINWTTRGTSATLASRIISNTTYAMSSLPNKIDYNTGLGVTKGDTAATSPLSARWGATLTVYDLYTGQSLHNITTDFPDTQYTQGSTDVADHGKYAMITQNGYFVCWDMRSGRLLWRSEIMDYPWGAASFGAYNTESAYGLIIWPTYDGIYAFNWTDGKIVWNYKATAFAHFESPYITNGTEMYPFQTTSVIADGKVYAWNTEHTQTYPVSRGWSTYCINVTTGQLLWRIKLDGAVGAIADGYMTGANAQDGYMYVFGKGKSATTVTAPDVVMPNGNGIVIKGMVVDMSPAQPNTPCVSKDSMALQMEYLHKQLPIDGLWHNETMTGVPVTLTAIDANNKVYDIGSVTTDGYYGTFSMSWTPPAEGMYKIIASFAGDDSYGSSGAATAVVMSPATATPTPVVTAAPINAATPTDLMTYIVGVGIAIIIAIAIVGALILRKK